MLEFVNVGHTSSGLYKRSLPLRKNGLDIAHSDSTHAQYFGNKMHVLSQRKVNKITRAWSHSLQKTKSQNQVWRDIFHFYWFPLHQSATASETPFKPTFTRNVCICTFQEWSL